ncbi:uncharacterized protein LOC130754803 isoform X2 [Actinidia eriantha]|uniref:uncharacterized protein LOC130754803 isoform X2 n=1 Tax=Actinidia eriantha TaxID=165200 RepID=UPI002583EF5C|nr:uncharacterized protein LOC130754803 isoform X2 [Actinidia eriantha]
MMHTKSESEVTSLDPSSPSRSPKRLYYVQSSSKDSHDGDKSWMQPTPNYNSPMAMESLSHPSFGRHFRNSSASWFSGILRSSSGRKGSLKRNDNGWLECNVIMEEGQYDDKFLIRRFRALLALLSIVVLLTVFCLIIWGGLQALQGEVSMKSLAVNNIYVGEGSDSTRVVTKMLTVNSSLKIIIYNPATFFGIHVSSSPINLVYSEITVATGQKYYQPRKSHRIAVVDIEGTKVPLYGAESSLSVSINNIVQVPLTLQFEIRSRGNVMGKLVRTNHRVQVSCPWLSPHL